MDDRLRDLGYLPWFLFVFVISCFTAPAAFSATYYVSDSTGNDAQSGMSTSSAWKTLSKVNSFAFQPGDTVLFKRGDIWNMQQLKITRNGQAGKPITFSAYGTGERPKFDASLAESPFYGVYVVGRSWIVIDGLYIYRLKKGVWIDGSNNITLKNSHVSHIGGECVRLKHDSNNVTIENNEIHDCGLTANGEGIYVGTDPLQAGGVPDRTKYINIKNNHIYNTKGEGVDLKAGSSDCIVQNNLIHDTYEGYNGAIHAGHWDSPLIIPNYVIASNTIYNVTGNGGYGIIVKSGAISIYNNIIYNTTQYAIQVRDIKGTGLTAKVYNNTLYKNSPGGIQILNNAIVESKNNLLWGNGSGDIGYDPLFADAADGDFRLCTGVGSPVASCSGRSKAIDTGINVGLPFSGTAPDLGALESNSSLPLLLSPSNFLVKTP